MIAGRFAHKIIGGTATFALVQPLRGTSMAISDPPERSKQTLSFAQYIEQESLSDVKHHFHHGVLIDVAGASLEHNIICGNLIRAMGNALDDSDCVVMPGDMKVFVSPNVAYYPDIVVVCAEPLVTLGEALQNPVLVAEVLSPSTAAFDRGGKFREYRSVPSLRHILFIEQDSPVIEHYERNAAEAWTLRGENDALQQNLELTVSGHRASLPLSKIYRNVTFPAVAPSAIDPATIQE